MPSNYIPRGLVPVEELFDHNDVPFKPAKKLKDPAVQEKNIGSQSYPKPINQSIELNVDQSSKFCSPMKILLISFPRNTVTWKPMAIVSSNTIFP